MGCDEVQLTRPFSQPSAGCQTSRKLNSTFRVLPDGSISISITAIIKGINDHILDRNEAAIPAKDGECKDEKTSDCKQ